MNFLQEARELFGHIPRPEHFTNYRHCCECAEHDETLRKNDLESLSYEEVSPGWDPLCYITPIGFQYYFPALMRLSIEGTGEDFFVDSLVFYLELDGKDNVRYLQFSPAQRRFVVKLLHHLIDQHAEEIESNYCTAQMFRVLEIWE